MEDAQGRALEFEKERECVCECAVVPVSGPMQDECLSEFAMGFGRIPAETAHIPARVDSVGCSIVVERENKRRLMCTFAPQTAAVCAGSDVRLLQRGNRVSDAQYAIPIEIHHVHSGIDVAVRCIHCRAN